MAAVKRYANAAQFPAFLATERGRSGTIIPPADRPHHERALRLAREGLGEEAFAAAWKSGGDPPRVAVYRGVNCLRQGMLRPARADARGTRPVRPTGAVERGNRLADASGSIERDPSLAFGMTDCRMARVCQLSLRRTAVRTVAPPLGRWESRPAPGAAVGGTQNEIPSCPSGAATVTYVRDDRFWDERSFQTGVGDDGLLDGAGLAV
jgi:hypothetical protein